MSDPSIVETAAHSWDEGKVTVKAGCETDGEKTYTCKDCGAVKVEPIPATGHAYGDWTELDENEHQRVCANDASHVETAAHKWNKGKVTVKAGCETDGEKTYTCKVCGAVKTEAIPATGHAYGDWTELNENEHQRVCANDASHVETAAHRWNKGKVTKEAEPGVEGEKQYTCKDCGAIKTEIIEALPLVLPDTGHIKAYINDRNRTISFVFWMEDEAEQPVSTGFDLDLTIKCNDSAQTEMYHVTNTVSAEEVKEQYDPFGVQRVCYVLEIPFDELNRGFKPNATLECNMTFPKGYFFEWNGEDSLDLSGLPYIVKPTRAGRTGYYTSSKLVLFVYFMDDAYNYVASDADVTIRIVNDDGTEMYNKTISVSALDFKDYHTSGNEYSLTDSKYCVRIEIPFDDITPGTSKYSVIYSSVRSYTGDLTTSSVVWDPETSTNFPTK